MFRSALVFILFVALGFGGFMFYHLGVLKPVQIEQTTRPTMVLLYKEFMGPYHKTVTAIEAVEKWAAENGKDLGITCQLSFGKYIDNPEGMEESRLRSHGGCVLPNDKDLATWQQALATMPAEFKISEEPAGQYVTATFEGSPGIGPLKVYPKVQEYLSEKRLKNQGPVIEIYEIKDREAKREMTTTYLFSIVPLE